MKTATLFALLACVSLNVASAQEKGKDKPLSVDKDTADKLKDLLDKAKDGLKDAAEKVDDKGRDLWARTKENLRLSREDYLKKATSAIKTMEAEIAVLAESGSAMNSRDYFQTRMEALKLHLDYCKRDLERLQATDSEEAFRVKQKGFDRGLGYLGDHIELAQEEAGI